MAQARRTDAPVEQGVVHRVKHAVANARQHREPGQHGVAGAGRKAKGRQAQQGEPRKQNGARTKTVHRKTRTRLHRARHHKEDGHEEAQLGIADLELVNHAGVSAQRGGRREAGSGCRGHGGIVVLRPGFWNATERQLSANLRQPLLRGAP
ncbi:hypothetical protein D3C87_1594560 [compost metagenome]